jgi:Leucine-rich repeat (LRR) protein
MLLVRVIIILVCLMRPVTWLTQACSDPVDVRTYQALFSLYNATKGYNWTYANSSALVHKWNFSSVVDDVDGAKRPCRDDWAGLTCMESLSSVRECNIIILDVTHFGLNGHLPGDIANITAIEEMYLSVNHISGTLSSYLGAMISVKKLIITTTDIYGSIPSELGLLVSCISLELVDNYLTGAVPPELVGMTKLTLLNFDGNFLSGSISSLQFPLLTTLTAAHNHLTGPVLSLLSGYTPLLTTLLLNYNSFSGTMSTDFGLLTDIRIIDLSANYFSGSLPTEIQQIGHLPFLSINLNLLDGSLPTEFGLLNMTSLQVSENKFSGRLPSELGLMESLVNLEVSDNVMTGTIPVELGQLVDLVVLYLNSNYFSGTVPSGVGALPRLREFIIAGNILSSTLPEQIFNSSVVELFIVASNYLSGSMSSLASNMLINLDFSVNYFSGQLTNVFGSDVADHFPKLLLADVSANAFTGNFPSVLFSLPRLQAFSGASNCFRGRLECEVKDRNSLQVLDLSGLSSGVTCRHYIISQSVLSQSGYYPINYMEGSIPSCFWSFANLTSLYLDGNGFVGSIGPSSTVLQSPKLTNLSLASNQLTGTIPQFITSRSKWVTLDLSSNRLHGQVTDLDICSGTNQVDVSVNRLSGHLSLTDACDWGNLLANVLEGNLFTYAVDDLASATYFEAMAFYGSYTLDVAMACAAPVLLLAFVITLGIGSYVVRTQVFVVLQQWNSRWKQDQACQVDSCRVVLAMTSFLVVYNFLLFPCLKRLSANAATHVNQYSWLFSAAYLHGALATILIIVPLAVCFIGVLSWSLKAKVVYSAQLQLSDRGKLDTVDVGEDSSATQAHGGDVITGAGVVSGLFSINLAVIGAANAGYLIAVLDNNPQITLIQVSLSVFKLSWNLVFVKNSLNFVKRSSAKSVINPLLFRFMVKLFNFVLVPCMATVLVSESCFLKLFQQQPAPTLYDTRCYGVRTLVNGTFVCSGATINDFTEGTLDPPFIYSYQCSSSLIKNYVPVLLYSYAITGFLIPIGMVIFMLLLNDSNGVVSKMANRIEKWTPRLLHKSTLATEWISPWSLFPAETLVGTALLSSTLFCTFGLAFPYLGAVIACGLVFEVWAWLIAVGKQLQLQFSGPQQATELVPWKSLVAEFTNRITLTQLVIVVVVTFAFWAGMLFDMIADVYGANSGLTTVLVVVLVGPSITVLSVLYLPSFLRVFEPIRFGGLTDGLRATGGKERLDSAASAVDERFSLNKSGAMSSPVLLNSDFRNEGL